MYRRRSRVRVAKVLCVAVVVGRDERYAWRAANGVDSLECWRDESSSSDKTLALHNESMRREEWLTFITEIDT